MFDLFFSTMNLLNDFLVGLYLLLIISTIAHLSSFMYLLKLNIMFAVLCLKTV